MDIPETQYAKSDGVEIAGSGEVLVSGTVRDLVAGSGIEFREHA
ncbi:MAG: hypothetical protein ABR600_09770 [Actinomycetota bacterium]